MASYNRVILVGNLTRDIELRYTPGGMAVTDIGLAVNDRRKSSTTGEWVEETTFVDVTLWGRTAEVASEYLSKGSPLLVEGRLKYDTWESDGQKRSKLRVVGERMQMLGSPGVGSSSGGGGTTRTRSTPNPAAQEVHYDSGEQHPAEHRDPPGTREAQPTGNGPGYDDPNIPF
ncbi:single-stranded DNA-binding protein [Novipirellula artificiosorum]|uniref:Single-stranded DNA-binding protein n=1 Tax=Novipirellula artificiosorum TaxID=2528016 RepID=A0A5C6DF72_9BACT|nr:single-stranded DNA-binding protein [Novipirellula artificiosorum]TWU33776.1 Single-stranded DNA-binding protein [Novipirellula artificiosorum]